ncbi:DUF551 domain-containing protein [Agrobacterium pusense]|uniref:DUF551 domain-containing protein n=1 Tax=Agrobacterium pusense TaxID=648995 RepID=UPI00088489BD|nr:DUF551 domain-containing protein [Agrobacterium pusense]OOO22745.1 hypothetical protein BTE56_04885 [Agrobacterium pusense]WKD45096.1 DUF551 domain-containing protein [Agrobacterium pusense]SDE61237.1 Protein of unknown function [Agrobacterium pusense]
MQSEIVEKCVKSAMLSVIKEHPIGHWNDDQVEKVARRAITEAALSAQVQDADEQRTETCQRCQGNGEIVTNWERYRHPHQNDAGDEAVAECPNCDGTGKVSAQVQEVARWRPIETAPRDGTRVIGADQLYVIGDIYWQPDGNETETGEPGWINGVRDRYEKDYVFNPTHWMPLPSLPAAPSQQEASHVTSK